MASKLDEELVDVRQEVLEALRAAGNKGLALADVTVEIFALTPASTPPPFPPPSPPAPCMF